MAIAAVAALAVAEVTRKTMKTKDGRQDHLDGEGAAHADADHRQAAVAVGARPVTALPG
jgi:hypothetical protein